MPGTKMDYRTPMFTPEPGPIQLSGIISALTFALDLTEGAVPGHSLRCCLLGMRIGTAAGLNFKQLASLYYALQMKDAGCSSNAARMSAMVGGGDERVLKSASKLTDWRRPSLSYLRELWRQCRPDEAIHQRAKQLFQLATSEENHTQDMLALRCERGADIVMHLQLGGAVADAVRNLDEHWDGSGFTQGKKGVEIPLLSRVCLIAQQLDVFAVTSGPDRAVATLSSAYRTWFDPELLAVARSLHKSGQLWTDCLPTDDVDVTRSAVLELDPGLMTDVNDSRIDRICEAFAGIVDAKSPFTYRHSLGVMQVSCAIAQEMDLPPATCDTIRRAALLHDIGKLAVSNAILDKEGKLNDAEWTAVRAHPGYSGTILRRVPTFARVAVLAEQHHERLDGSGYPNRRAGDELSVESRIIALADCYSAMAEDRPYREGRSKDNVLEQLSPEAPKKLDGDCFAALRSASRRWDGSFPRSSGEKEQKEAPSPALPWNFPPLAELIT